MDNFDLDELISMKKPTNSTGLVTSIPGESLAGAAAEVEGGESEDYDDFDESDEEYINGKVEGTDGYVIPGGTGAGPQMYSTMHYMQDTGDVKDEYGNNVQGANNDLD